MPKSNYGFLKKLQQNERKKDDSNTMKIAVVGGAPLSQRFGKSPEVSFTGLGEDGRLQPENPAKMVETENGTAMLHEGEIEVRLPDGRTTIIPANQIPQQMMQKLEKSQLKGAEFGSEVEGFQRGGRFERDIRTQFGGRVPRVRPNIPGPQTNPRIPQGQGAFNQFGRLPTGNDPNNAQQLSNFGQLVGGRVPRVPLQGPGVTNPLGKTPETGPVIKDDPNQQGFVVDTSQFKDPYDVILPEGKVNNQVNPDPTKKEGLWQHETDPNQYEQSEGNIYNPNLDPTKKEGLWQHETDPDTILPEGKTIPLVDYEKELEELNKVDPSQLDTSNLQQYINQLQMIASGQGQLGKQAMIESQQKFKAEEQAAKESQLQGLAQAGVTGREATTEKAMLTRDLAAAEAGLEGQLRKQQDERAFAAAQQLPGAQLAADQFEEGQEQFDEQMAFAKEQYGDKLGQRIADDINNGFTYEQIKEKYPNVTEDAYNSMKDVTSSTQWQKIFDADQEQLKIGNEHWDEQMAFAKQQYDDLEAGRIVAAINNGMDYEAVKAMYPDLTQETFDSVQTAGPIGQLDYNKQMTKLAMMKDAGDLDGWAENFEEVFGSGIDIGHLQGQQDLDSFYEGMGVMQDLIASGADWDTAKKMMADSGALDMLGMPEGDAEAFFESSKLQNDPLFKMNEMVQGWVDNKLIDQDDADIYMEIFKDSLVNPNGYKVEDGFQILDKKGNEVGFFKNEADATKFLEDNKDKDYTSTEIDNHITKTNGTGTGPDGTGTGTTPEWADGDLYKPLQEVFGDTPLTEDQYRVFDENFDETMAVLKGKYTDVTKEDIQTMKQVYDALPDSFKEKKDFRGILKQVSPQDLEFYDAIQNNEVATLINAAPGETPEYSKDSNDARVLFSGRSKRDGSLGRWAEENKGKYVDFNGKKFKLDKATITGDSTGDWGNYDTLYFTDPQSGVKFTVKVGHSGDAIITNAEELFGAYNMGHLATEDSKGEMTAVDDTFWLQDWPETAYTGVEKII